MTVHLFDRKAVFSGLQNALSDRSRSKKLLLMMCVAVFSPNSFAQYLVESYLPSGYESSNTPGDVSFNYNRSDASGDATAVVAFTSSPVASVSFSATAFNPLGGIALTSNGGFLTYRFEVAAQPFTQVPIDFSGIYSSYQGARGSLAATSFTIQSVNSSASTYSTFQSYLYGDCGSTACLQFTTFNNTSFTSMQSDVSHVAGTFEGSLNMLTGADGLVIGSVQLYAGANLSIGYVSASATAFIDPHLEINAAFLAANPGATLTITPGVGNLVSAVPEPGSYALMVGGLAVIAILTRRRAGSRAKMGNRESLGG